MFDWVNASDVCDKMLFSWCIDRYEMNSITMNEKGSPYVEFIELKALGLW